MPKKHFSVQLVTILLIEIALCILSVVPANAQTGLPATVSTCTERYEMNGQSVRIARYQITTSDGFTSNAPSTNMTQMRQTRIFDTLNISNTGASVCRVMLERGDWGAVKLQRGASFDLLSVGEFERDPLSSRPCLNAVADSGVIDEGAWEVTYSRDQVGTTTLDLEAPQLGLLYPFLSTPLPLLGAAPREISDLHGQSGQLSFSVPFQRLDQRFQSHPNFSRLGSDGDIGGLRDAITAYILENVPDWTLALPGSDLIRDMSENPTYEFNFRRLSLYLVNDTRDLLTLTFRADGSTYHVTVTAFLKTNIRVNQRTVSELSGSSTGADSYESHLNRWGGTRSGEEELDPLRLFITDRGMSDDLVRWLWLINARSATDYDTLFNEEFQPGSVGCDESWLTP